MISALRSSESEKGREMEYTPFIYVHSFMLHNYVTFGKVAENFGEQKKHLEGSISFRVNAWVEWTL